MNREILFRAKRLEERDWTCGYYIRLAQADNIEKNYIVRNYGKYDVVCHEIDTDTLGEYTGMRDKYGVDIYEGDIIRYTDFHKKPYFAKIIYEGTQFKCIWQDEMDYFRKDLEYWTKNKEVDVVGNIHDCPGFVERM